jgi:predicted RNase H-like HicB family nuclease
MAKRRKHLVAIEKADDGSYSAYVLDLPGCAVCGQDAPAEVLSLVRDAIDFHIEGLIERGSPVPEPTSSSEYVMAKAG